MLTEFRNYERLRLDLGGAPVVLTGPNGAGKTNLLEAVSLLAPGRGLRRARLAEIPRRAASAPGAPAAWGIAATIDGTEGPVEIGTGRDLAAAPGVERRAVRIDGRPVRGQAPLGEHVAAVWLTPQMDRLFLEGASDRRRFLDRLVFAFDRGHAGRVTAYETAMRERARLLQAGGADPAWLAALESEMAERGVAVAAARREAVRRLGLAAAEGIGPFPRAGLGAAGTVEDWLHEMPALAAEDRFRAALRDARGADAAAGTTTVGPHRSDLAVEDIGRREPAARCSTGEQKALLLSIVLATARCLEADLGRVPLLLLDEVAAHLDGERRGALLDEIAGLGAQAWLTGTEAEAFQRLRGRAEFLRVADARLQPT